MNESEYKVMFGILMHAIPGAGKTTVTAQLIRDYEAVVVSRDAIREDFYREHQNANGTYPKWVEQKVTVIQERIMRACFERNVSVIVDDTNLNTRVTTSLANIAVECGAVVKNFFVDVPVQDAIDRNLSRASKGGRKVPVHVIRSMAEKSYLPNGRMAHMVADKNGVYHYTTHEVPVEERIVPTMLDEGTVRDLGAVYEEAKNEAYRIAQL